MYPHYPPVRKIDWLLLPLLCTVSGPSKFLAYVGAECRSQMYFSIAWTVYAHRLSECPDGSTLTQSEQPGQCQNRRPGGRSQLSRKWLFADDSPPLYPVRVV